MNEYIFYTTEGYCESPNKSCKVENCQLLAYAKGINVAEAQENMLKDNPWIIEYGYNINNIIHKQVLTRKQHADILALIDALYSKEQQYSMLQNAETANDIGDILKRLRDI